MLDGPLFDQSINAEVRRKAETQINPVLQESAQISCFLSPWNCFSLWLKQFSYDLSLHTSPMRSTWELQLVQSPVLLHSSNLTKGLQTRRIQIRVLDLIRTYILICHTRTPSTGRRVMPLPHQVGCSHLGTGAADAAQRMMLAQSQYLDSYQPVDLDKWQPRFPGTLKISNRKQLKTQGYNQHPPDLPHLVLNCNFLLCLVLGINRK